MDNFEGTNSPFVNLFYSSYSQTLPSKTIYFFCVSLNDLTHPWTFIEVILHMSPAIIKPYRTKHYLFLDFKRFFFILKFEN